MPFATLVAFLLNLRKSSTAQELQEFFSTLHDQPIAETPTRSAVWKARQNLNAEAFSALNSMSVGQFRSQFTASVYYGFRLLGVDGTTLRLPDNNAVQKVFGDNLEGPPLARVSLLYDIGRDLAVDAQLAALCVSERELAIDHLSHVRQGDLVIYDRGYPAFWLMAMHRAKGVDFCMRLSRSGFSAAEDFWASDQASTVITLEPSAEQRRACRDQGLSTAPLPIRLVRVRLKGGDTEVLATSVLDEQRLPSKAFGALYHKRWGVEEKIKRHKRWAEIENFSGQSVLSIRQDFHAKILAVNLAAMIRQVANYVARRHFAKRKHAMQVHWTAALSILKNTLVRLLLHETSALQELWTQLIRTLARCADIIRPDRSFARHQPGRLKLGFHPKYKRAA